MRCWASSRRSCSSACADAGHAGRPRTRAHRRPRRAVIRLDGPDGANLAYSRPPARAGAGGSAPAAGRGPGDGHLHHHRPLGSEPRRDRRAAGRLGRARAMRRPASRPSPRACSARWPSCPAPGCACAAATAWAWAAATAACRWPSPATTRAHRRGGRTPLPRPSRATAGLRDVRVDYEVSKPQLTLHRPRTRRRTGRAARGPGACCCARWSTAPRSRAQRRRPHGAGAAGKPRSRRHRPAGLLSTVRAHGRRPPGAAVAVRAHHRDGDRGRAQPAGPAPRGADVGHQHAAAGRGGRPAARAGRRDPATRHGPDVPRRRGHAGAQTGASWPSPSPSRCWWCSWCWWRSSRASPARPWCC
jgi:hypothetical protein